METQVVKKFCIYCKGKLRLNCSLNYHLECHKEMLFNKPINWDLVCPICFSISKQSKNYICNRCLDVLIDEADGLDLAIGYLMEDFEFDKDYNNIFEELFIKI